MIGIFVIDRQSEYGDHPLSNEENTSPHPTFCTNLSDGCPLQRLQRLLRAAYLLHSSRRKEGIGALVLMDKLDTDVHLIDDSGPLIQGRRRLSAHSTVPHTL